MPHTEVTVTRLAIAALRQGPNTVVCRHLKTRLAEGREVSLETLAGDLNINPLETAALFTVAREQALRWLEEAERRQLGLITALDADYPDRLAEIADPPVAFWRHGPAPLFGKSIAIVGSRTATPAGLVVARDLSGDLARRGYTIVSGLAAGVDGAAHQAALDAGGSTIAVLGCGVDVAYPYRHRALARAVAESGCLVSEFPPGSEPLAWHFPLRNRIISGLAQAVVVVEASQKSGSLITAKCAADQGRDVLAVPGSVATGRYRGCHALIRDGARLVETVDDILEEVEGILRRPKDDGETTPLLVSYLQSAMARTEPYTLDELVLRTGRPASELLIDLVQLEIDGRISRTPTGRFVWS
jgi:DNA processing protein